jgi:hypothetical protein
MHVAAIHDDTKNNKAPTPAPPPHQLINNDHGIERTQLPSIHLTIIQQSSNNHTTITPQSCNNHITKMRLLAVATSHAQ